MEASNNQMAGGMARDWSLIEKALGEAYVNNDEIRDKIKAAVAAAGSQEQAAAAQGGIDIKGGFAVAQGIKGMAGQFGGGGKQEQKVSGTTGGGNSPGTGYSGYSGGGAGASGASG